MSALNITDLLVSNGQTQRKVYNASQIIAALDGGGGGGTPRTTETFTYFSLSVSPTVRFTLLQTDGTTVIVARTTVGVTQVGSLPLWKYVFTPGAVTDCIAVWDEGNVSDYVAEWIVIDT